MTNPSDKPGNSSFSTFGLGVAFGIAAAFLFGTEEGRKIVKKTLEKLPDKFKNPINPLSSVGARLSRPSSFTPLITPEETQHHAVFAGETPPPPAPHVRPSRPEPFTPNI